MIELTPKQQHFVEAQIASGFYQAPEEVVAEAFELLSQKKMREQEEINTAIHRCIPDMEAGRGTPLEAVDAEIRAKFGFDSKKS